MKTKLQQKLQRMKPDTLFDYVYTDPLTGLYNRKLFEEISYASIFIIDLDNMKYLNDTGGHKMGDFFLKKLASLLKENFDDESLLFRLHGDEFAIVVKKRSELFQIRSRLQKLQNLYKFFTFGIGKTVEEADENLYSSKLWRQIKGERVCFPEKPAWYDYYVKCDQERKFL